MHLLAIQEAFSSESSTFPSSTRFKVVAGPSDGFKNGDVELWFSRTLKWQPGGEGRAAKPEDFTMLYCQRDLLLVNLILLNCCFDICVVHLPHISNRPDEATIEPAIKSEVLLEETR